MTATDKVRFAQAFNRLAVTTRLPAAEGDAAMQRLFFEGLSDYPVEAVEAAALEIARKSQWFPKLAEWRDAVKVARRTAASRLPAPRRLELPGEVENVPSVVVTDLQEAMDDYLAMRAAGVSREDACRGLEGLLRVLLPIRRVWNYDCHACLDTGFEPFTDERGRNWTQRCICWNTNPTLRRMRERTFGAQASA